MRELENQHESPGVKIAACKNIPMNIKISGQKFKIEVFGIVSTYFS